LAAGDRERHAAVRQRAWGIQVQHGAARLRGCALRQHRRALPEPLLHPHGERTCLQHDRPLPQHRGRSESGVEHAVRRHLLAGHGSGARGHHAAERRLDPERDGAGRDGRRAGGGCRSGAADAMAEPILGCGADRVLPGTLREGERTNIQRRRQGSGASRARRLERRDPRGSVEWPQLSRSECGSGSVFPPLRLPRPRRDTASGAAQVTSASFNVQGRRMRFAPLVLGMAVLPALVFSGDSAGAAPCSPALLSAVEQGDVPSIAADLDAGAPIRCADDKGSTLLHVLVIEWIQDEDDGPPSDPVAKLLIARGADANALDSAGKTPLMLACMLQKIDAVQGLLAAGANPNAAGPDSSSALEYALRAGDPDILTALLRGGANPNQRVSGKGLPLI